MKFCVELCISQSQSEPMQLYNDLLGLMKEMGISWNVGMPL